MDGEGFLEGQESDIEELLEVGEGSGEDYSQGGLSRRKFLAATSPVVMSSLSGCIGDPGFDDFGEFSIDIRDPLFKGLPFTSYYSPTLENKGQNIEDRAEENLGGRSVSSSDNKAKLAINYYEDNEVLSMMEDNPDLVGDPEAITRLIDWNHYAIIKMGIEAGGPMKDIQQYLSKDLAPQYANNAAKPFHDTLQITYEVAGEQFDINPGSDERDDQFIGMNLYMLGNGDSKAGRYFNTTEIKRYAEGSEQNLQQDLMEEATQDGGFSFYL